MSDRKERLLRTIKLQNEQLEQWEKKRTTSGDPDEKLRCDDKISDIKALIIQNEEELKKLKGDGEIIDKTEDIDSPTVFISYSWDDDYHKEWVLNLTRRLFENGINVLLDQLDLKAGENLIHFMESSISKSKKVLIIFTPNYKLKAEKREGGVGFEYSILNAELYTKITSNDKFIPILKTGNFLESVPAFMQQFIAIDMTNQTDFEDRVTELIYAIYDKPQIEKPETGSSPFKIQPK